MILKALYDYYHRCDDLAPEGMEYKEISFLIVINEDGKFVRLEDVRSEDKKQGTKYLVVKGSRSGTTPKPYMFWDNVEYTCNFVAPKPKDTPARLEETQSKAAIKHSALITRFNEISCRYPDNKSLKAVCDFYNNGELAKVYMDPLWESVIKKPTVNISYRIEGSTTIVAEETCLSENTQISSDIISQGDSAICIITGKPCKPVESTTPTPIPGGQATARLVAFQINSGYDSYGKQKGLNAPISKEAADAFTTALNRLVGKDSPNKFLIGNRTFTFWASHNTEAASIMETALAEVFSYTTDSQDDDPNSRIGAIVKAFKSIYSGDYPSTSDDRFYILGLAPNSARIAVVYWNETSLKEFSSMMLRHFDDMEIIRNPKDRYSFMGLYNILRAVTRDRKISDVLPSLPEAVIKSIIQGIPYPYTLMAQAIQRIRAEHNVTPERAAIIKAYLNRLNNNNNHPLSIMLDKDNANIGYLCGRLFSVLDYTQKKASGGKTATVAERYMNSASSNPVSVFPTLLNLSVHHLEKITAPGTKVFIEKLKAEIINKIDANGCFPAQLDIYNQGRFMVGYYHQMHDFYTSNKEIDNKENVTNSND